MLNPLNPPYQGGLQSNTDISTDCLILSLMYDNTIAIRVFNNRPKTDSGFPQRRVGMNSYLF